MGQLFLVTEIFTYRSIYPPHSRRGFEHALSRRGHAGDLVADSCPGIANVITILFPDAAERHARCVVHNVGIAEGAGESASPGTIDVFPATREVPDIGAGQADRRAKLRE